MGFCPMKIVFDGMLLRVGGVTAFPVVVFSVMRCSRIRDWCFVTFQVSYRTMFTIAIHDILNQTLVGGAIQIFGKDSTNNLPRIEVRKYPVIL